MQKEILDSYLEAGRIAAAALAFGKTLVKPDARVVEVAEAIEAKIVELGGRPAFPVNISINEIAAHYSPPLTDKTVIRGTDYVKLDVGVHVDGWIGDTAVTVRLAGGDSLIECAEKMLNRMLPLFRPGTPLAEIGAVAESTAKEFGLKPIRNLTGHALARYNLHAGVVVPNIRTTSTKVLAEGEVYAVEPFCTAGGGWVRDAEPPLIFRWLADRPVRLAEARKMLQLAKVDFSGLPFAKRWLEKQMSAVRLELALKQAVAAGALHPYNILKESSGAPVGQAEHTVIVAERPIVTTKI